MPIHFQPRLRAREEALETSGLIKTLDSVGVTVVKAEEAIGKRIKHVPPDFAFIFNGQKITAT